MSEPRIGFDETAIGIARDLIEIGAVIVRPSEPFTWASGLRSPLYCDNRLTMGYPDVRRGITDGFAERLKRLGWKVDVVVGTATAGIPQAAWLSDRLGCPLAYVRSSAKVHGKGRKIEGVVQEGAGVVVIEDLVSTGGSSLAAAEALREAGAQVHGVLAIFSYGMPEAEGRFENAGIPLVALTGLEALLEVALETGRLNESEIAAVREWQVDPEAWSNERS
jgi:orotate phosphoribosyltransferase